MSSNAIILFVTVEACCMCFELYKFVIIPLILSSCQLTRLDRKCWPLDDGTHPDLCSLSLQGSLYGLYICFHNCLHWTWTSCNSPQTNCPKQCEPMLLVSPIHWSCKIPYCSRCRANHSPRYLRFCCLWTLFHTQREAVSMLLGQWHPTRRCEDKLLQVSPPQSEGNTDSVLV